MIGVLERSVSIIKFAAIWYLIYVAHFRSTIRFNI